MAATPVLRDQAPDRSRFVEAVLAGLGADAKRLPCKYFYDERGSELFERICGLEEYYLTRTEVAIMEKHAAEMAAALGPRCLLIEYGSGSGRKTRLLLETLAEPRAYVPIDLSRTVLLKSAGAIAAAFPSLEVVPLLGDYTGSLDLPEIGRPAERRIVYFPGSTIGNFTPPEAASFLARMRRIAGPAGGLLIGADLKKDPRVLEAAYDDRQGVTAAFNLNLLERINRELGADFRLDRFRHLAFYNAPEGRIEMHLVSTQPHEVRVAGETFSFSSGERIHTENSYKYTLEEFGDLAARAGLNVRRVWTDADRMFSVQYLTPA